MPRGGRRPGAGRPKGVPNKLNAEIRGAALAGGESPLDYMLRIMRDEKQEPERRDKMAVAAAPYLHSKMTAVQHGGSIGLSPLAQILEEIDGCTAGLPSEDKAPEKYRMEEQSNASAASTRKDGLCGLLGVTDRALE